MNGDTITDLSGGETIRVVGGSRIDDVQVGYRYDEDAGRGVLNVAGAEIYLTGVHSGSFSVRAGDGYSDITYRGAFGFAGTAGDDMIAGGDGADSLSGGAGRDRLSGGGGDDRLSGDGRAASAQRAAAAPDGDDFIDGGLGADVMIGGGGRDLFLAGVDATDRITDFLAGDAGDRIDLGPVMAALGLAAGSDPFAAGRLRLEQRQDATALVLDADGPGGAVGRDILSLDGVSAATLTAANFVNASYTPVVNRAPTAIAISGGSVAENGAAGSHVGVLRGSDPDGDVLTYTLVDDAGGRIVVDAATGAIATTGPLDHEASGSITFVARAADPRGLTIDRSFSFSVDDVDEAPLDLRLDTATIVENAAPGTLVGRFSATDPEGGALRYGIVGSRAPFAVDATTGALATTAPLDFETASSHVLTVRATDAGGLAVDRRFTIHVVDVAEGPVANRDAATVDEDASSANLWDALLANDRPAGPGTLAITRVDTTGTLGSVIFDPGAKTLRYVADNDAFDTLAPGAATVDSFTYTVVYKSGLTSTAVVEVTVVGVNDGVRLVGTWGSNVLSGGGGEDRISGLFGDDTLNGLGGHDLLSGGFGNDKLNGGDGNDVLFGGIGDDQIVGGAGKDVLFGGSGTDILTGGSGADVFHFGRFDGKDTITDFDTSADRLVLDDDVVITRHRVTDANRDGILDLGLDLSPGTSVTLLGVRDFGSVQFAGTDYWSDHQPGLDGFLDTIADKWSLSARHDWTIPFV